ncbi:MAG: tail fiber protein [Burkholderiaceae bacterium]|nr:tail fiber protein [Burkholderiaceae bacterium]
MAKTKISEFSTNPANNTDINGINIAEGCAPSGINNAIRQLMSDLKEFQTGAAGDDLTVGGNLVVTGTTTLTGVPTAPTAAPGTNTQQIATTAFVLANGAPTGGLMMWPTATAPLGWLLCNGSAVSRSTYAALFALLGTTFGAGDGATTFNLPNYADRMPIGAGTIAAVAATGGSKDAVVVSHAHTVQNGGAHNHSTVYGWHTDIDYFGNNVTAFTQPGMGVSGNNTYIVDSTGSAHAHTIDASGVSGTNANLPPYMGINFIIKA